MAFFQTGSLIQISTSKGRSLPVLIERGTDDKHGITTVVFLNPVKPYEFMKISQIGQVSFSREGTKKHSLIQVIEKKQNENENENENEIEKENQIESFDDVNGDGIIVAFKCQFFQQKMNLGGTEGWFLGYENDKLVANSTQTWFLVNQISTEIEYPIPSLKKDIFELSISQKQSFYSNGFIHIRNAIPIDLINQALKRINHELGKPNSLSKSGDETQMGKLGGNVASAIEVRNLLFKSPALSYVESLLGKGNCKAPSGAQIALRFPEYSSVNELPGHDWHVDGMRQAKLHPFSLLVGVTLSAQPEPLSGNFTIFPGAHLKINEIYQKDPQLIPMNNGENRQRSNQNKDLNFGIPIQVLANKGDLLIAHPYLPHTVAPNLSSDIRYQVYFRLSHLNHDDMQDIFIKDMWADLEGMKEIGKPLSIQGS